MHKAFNVILVLLLVVALAVPAFAHEHFEGMGMPDSFAEKLEEYTYIVHFASDSHVNVLLSNSPFTVDLINNVVKFEGGYGYIRPINGAWIETSLPSQSKSLDDIKQFYFSSHNIHDENGDIYYFADNGGIVTNYWYNGEKMPMFHYLEDRNAYPYCVISDFGTDERLFMYHGIFSDKPLVWKNGRVTVQAGSNTVAFDFNKRGMSTAWASRLDAFYAEETIVGGNVLVWADHIIKDTSGKVVLEPSEAEPIYECDGSYCPASDTNLDNYCDDCGLVLTMSLRSTLLDYARNFAEDNNSGYSYWAIFQISDQYRVYVSETPITSPNGVMIEGTDLKYALLYEHDNGTFGNGSWYSGFDVNLKFIEANHTIENFTAPPLAVIIQGVTGEAMKTTLPNLHQTMKILALCGVGCLALLIGLKLFGKRSLLFPRR